jgi:hypothetical protein
VNDYPASLDVRPLTTWPGTLTRPDQRQRSQFSAPLRQTLDTLDRELYQLAARHPVLEVAIEPGQFRIDGRPRAQAKAEHPGVVLSLPKTSVGALRYATDRFLTWHDTLRAIALGLEALRKVDRYGITKRGEQYAGFRELPAGATALPPAMTVDDAARVLAGAVPFDEHGHGWDGGDLMDDADTVSRVSVSRAYRLAAMVHHPDAGGDRATWDRLEQAKRVLDQHGGQA